MSLDRKIGLALGSGLARGLAHIGVLKVLLQAGVRIDYIAGTSMGSVVAALFAGGLKMKFIERLALRISRQIWMDFTLPRMGLIAGDRLEELLYLLTGRRNIEEFSLPLAVVAVDLESGKRVVLRSGPAARSVRASCSIPGIFSPVELGGKLLVDGGVLERVPSSVVREMGADLVIAVDVDYDAAEYKINNIFDVLSKTLDIMSREICRSQYQEANILITPAMKDLAPFHFHRAKEAIARGEEAARQALPLLKLMI
ncbi:MAG: patatin-like phospholipase family protein [Bacillota bacterium]